ncbi:TPA: RecT family recombinase [Morganella morganii]
MPELMTQESVPSIFSADGLDKMLRFAEVMARGTVTVPAHLKGQESDCLAIAMQAAQWNMNPFAVAQKTHIINGVLGYEAQLVNALISSSSAIHGRFHYEYGGDGWEKCTVSKEVSETKSGRNGSYEVTKRVRGWTDADEHGLFIRVGAILRGDTEITWGEPVYLSSVVIRNSPLWATNPKQQIAYLAVKYWARLYCPEVILGVYTPDELEERPVKDVTPPKERVTLSELSHQQAEPRQPEPVKEVTGELVEEFDAEAIRRAIDTAETLDAVKDIRSRIDEGKKAMGITLFTELKNKAVQAYHVIDSRNLLEVEINSLPEPGTPEAAEAFQKVEQLLNARKTKLGAELYEQFSMTLSDMKPEYQ